MKNAIKFYVSDKEKRQLELLAEMNYTNVSNFVRMTALGVKIKPPKEIYIPVPEKVQERDEKSSEKGLNEDDRKVLEELISRSSNDGYIKFDIEFNKRLQDLARRWLDE